MRLRSLRPGDRASINLWVALLVPVLMLLFFMLYLGLMAQSHARVVLQDAGDLGALAASGYLDEAAMLSGEIIFDEDDAAAAAREYVTENYAAAGMSPTLTPDELFSNGLTLDENNRVLGAVDGITVRFLYPGEDVDPFTGGYVLKPTVLVVGRITVRHAFTGDATYQIYSAASPQ